MTLPDLTDLAADGYGHWLAGFIDGEGCFVIFCGSSSNWKCAFTIELRDDDLPALQDIRTRTGIGGIRRQRARRTSNPQATWCIQSRGDCLGLVAILDAFPLRAKKASDYRHWRRAVMAWSQVARTNVMGYNADAWREMNECRVHLMEGRAYSAHVA